METKTRGKTAKKKNSSQARALRAMLIILAVLTAALGALYYFIIYREQRRQDIMHGDTFHEGITVNGVDIGGLTKKEAASLLSVSAEKEIAESVKINFLCGGKSYTANSSLFDITCNTDKVLSEAMALGREGTYEELRDELKDIRENGRAYTLEFEAEPVGIESFIHSFADEVTVAPTPASFAVRYPKVKEGTKAYDTMNIGIIGGSEAGAATAEAVSADTDLRDVFFTFTESTDGYGVDIPSLMETVKAHCAAQDFSDIEVQMAPIKSDVTIESLKEKLVLRGSAVTTYKKKRNNRDRCFNLEKACGMVYGTVLQPQDVFSANGILGNRTIGNGWKPAAAVISGGAAHEDQPGGGVCQIATTTYMAVLRGDFEVVARRAHSTPSGYPNGLDATINTISGEIDFKWKNDTESPVYVFTWIDNKEYEVHCEIYGEPFPPDFDEIELSSELIEPLEPGLPEYTVMPSLYSPYWMLQNEAVKGYIYESFKTYKLNGKVVDTKSLGRTTYRMHPMRYYVWPGYAGEPLQPQYQLVQNNDGSLGLLNPAVDPQQP